MIRTIRRSAATAVDMDIILQTWLVSWSDTTASSLFIFESRHVEIETRNAHVIKRKGTSEPVLDSIATALRNHELEMELVQGPCK